jgi:hypothetical protein
MIHIDFTPEQIDARLHERFIIPIPASSRGWRPSISRARACPTTSSAT